jgi:hypothetical protein
MGDLAATDEKNPERLQVTQWLATVSRSLSRFRCQSQGIRRSTAAGFAGCKVHGQAKSQPAVAIPLKGLEKGVHGYLQWG